MNEIVLYSVIALGILGLVLAVVLYLVAQKFKVEEDPRIDQIVELLPGANCGGCGFPGCRGLATALASATDIEGLVCPVSSGEVMQQIGVVLGQEIKASAPKIAVVRCNGTCQNRPNTSKYDGAPSCAFASTLFAGETGCSYGCLGCGDCVDACNWGAISINKETGLPEVDQDKCGGCGSCARACPKGVIEVRNKGPKDRRIFVSCVNKDKGAVARKACTAACIGCGKCTKVCAFEAITVENNVAYIDYNKCRLCRKCVAECPTGAIHAPNFPPLPPKPAAAPVEPKVATAESPKVEVSEQPKSENTNA